MTALLQLGLEGLGHVWCAVAVFTTKTWGVQQRIQETFARVFFFETFQPVSLHPLLFLILPSPPPPLPRPTSPAGAAGCTDRSNAGPSNNGGLGQAAVVEEDGGSGSGTPMASRARRAATGKPGQAQAATRELDSVMS